jgi:hypothetical protein
MTKQIQFLSAILISIVISTTSCSTDSLPDYTLTIEIIPQGAGTTNPLPGGFDEGANLELEAIPAENYLFDRWEGDLTTESNPADLTMNSDKVITAVFKRAPLTLGGDGSQSNPYQVHTLDDLVAIGLEENLDKHYIQVADIDASASAELSNGSGFQRIGTRENPFTGSYNGNGHTISSLFVSQVKICCHGGGPFGYLKNGLIEQLTIDNRATRSQSREKNFKSENPESHQQKKLLHDISTSNLSGNGGFIHYNDGGIVRDCHYKGPVIAYISQDLGGFIGVNTGTVENSHFEGTVFSGYAAGFVWANTGQIRNSSTKGSADGISSFGFVNTNYGEIINSYTDMEIDGSLMATGFAHSNIDGSIELSFSVGSTFSRYNIAGFVRNNSGEIRNVYLRRDLELEIDDYREDSKIAGFVISNEDKGVIENSYFVVSVDISGNSDSTKAAIIENLGTIGSLYWDMERSGLNDAVFNGNPEGATGLTTAQMTGPAAEQNMPSFDWVNIWRTTEDGYPVLRWEEQ